MKIGYARVSTMEQNPDLQIDELRAAGCDEIYIDRMSGAKVDRPELNNCLRHLREGDTLVIWRLDRLARSLRHLIEIVEDLDRRAVGLRSLRDPIDTTSAAGKLVFQVFGAMAEFERNLIRERVKAGLDAAKKRGRRGGRPRSLSQADVRKAQLLINGGETATDVAKTFGVGRATLYRELNRQVAKNEP